MYKGMTKLVKNVGNVDNFEKCRSKKGDKG